MLQVLFYLIQSFRVLGYLISEDVLIFGCESVADVLGECNSTHDQPKHDFKHGQGCDCVVINTESLIKNQRNLTDVLNLFRCFCCSVSFLGIVDILSLSVVFPFESTLNPKSLYEIVTLINSFWCSILISQLDNISLPKV